MAEIVAIVDLATGLVLEFPGHTASFDVPATFDRTAPGKQSIWPARVQPLSGRARGEECLVESSEPGKFLLSVVEPAPTLVEVR